MIQEKFTLTTIVTGNDTGENTFEISRTWNEEKQKALLIALYPTIDVYHTNSLDLSSMYLLNHATEMNLGSIRILNLYSKVQTGKPSASKLTEDIENLAYKGNQDAICIYIDIKSALNSLPLNYKHCVKDRFMYQNKSASITEANKGLKLMEDFLNGR